MGKLSGSKRVRREVEPQDDNDIDINELAVDELDDDDLDLTTGDGEWSDEVEQSEAVETGDDEEWIDEESDVEASEDTGEFDSVAHYFKESARHRLLPHDRERELTQAVKRGRQAKKRLDTRPTKSLSATGRKS